MREADLLRADIELGRFVRYQYMEAKRLGYPSMAAFAKEMSRGTVAPLTEEDPMMEIVGAFYSGITGDEKVALDWKYLKTGSAKHVAELIGLKTRHQLYAMVKGVQKRCADYLVKHT